MRQVIINLIDNAVEALGGPAAPDRPDGQPPTIVVTTAHDAAAGTIRLVISDNGPDACRRPDRDSLFPAMLFSTKRAGQRPRSRMIVRAHRHRTRRPDSGWRGTAGDRCLPSRSARGGAGREDAGVYVFHSDCSNDEAGGRGALGGVLRDEGYAVDAVGSGEACLEQVTRQPY